MVHLTAAPETDPPDPLRDAARRAWESGDRVTASLLGGMASLREECRALAAALAGAREPPRFTDEQMQGAAHAFARLAARSALRSGAWIAAAACLASAAAGWWARDAALGARAEAASLALSLELADAERWLALVRDNRQGLAVLREGTDPRTGRPVVDLRGWKGPPPAPAP